MKIPYILTASNLTAIINGIPFVVETANSFFPAIKQAIRDGNDTLLIDLIDKSRALVTKSEGKVYVQDGVIYYGQQPVHNTISKKILDFLADGLPFEPLVKFLENLMLNPSKRALDELYTYCEKYSLPICDDGCFLAYKAVNSNLMDKHSNTIKNSSGAVISMPRNQCVDNHAIACASSLHCGNFNYVKRYGSGSDDRFVMVKVNPRDVVCCPSDSLWEKLRVCEYTVMAEVPREAVVKFNSEYAPKTENAKYLNEAAKTEKPVSKFTNNTHKKLKRDNKGRFVKEKGKKSK